MQCLLVSTTTGTRCLQNSSVNICKHAWSTGCRYGIVGFSSTGVPCIQVYTYSYPVQITGTVPPGTYAATVGRLPVCKHRNVYRCLQIYKRIVTRPLAVLLSTANLAVIVHLFYNLFYMCEIDMLWAGYDGITTVRRTRVRYRLVIS